MAKSKKAYELAQKAFYEKDPKSMALIQLKTKDAEDEQIYLEEESDNKPAEIASVQVQQEEFAKSRDEAVESAALK